MLPIRDEMPTHRPAVVTFLLLVASVYMFFFVQPRGPEQFTRFLYERAAISCEVITAQPLTLDEITRDRCERTADPAAFPDKSIVVSLFSSLFLHANLAHLLGNMWVFWIFGNNVEDRMGRVRYLIFYLVAGLVATLVHVALNPSSTVPLIGASGAIAGVMGAYLVLFPSARILSVIPPLFFLPFRVPALVFLVVWFLGQFTISAADPQVAWLAHVGGFVVGVVTALVFRRRLPPSGFRR